jgi:hypothetical protein
VIVSPRTKKLYTFPIDDELARALKALKVIDGISEAEQIREAIRSGIRNWLRSRGYARPAHRSWADVAEHLETIAAEQQEKKTERKRAATRKRS